MASVPCTSSTVRPAGRGLCTQLHALSPYCAAFAAITAASKAAAPAAAAAGGVAPGSAAAIIAMLPNIGLFLLSVAAAIFLLCSIPTVWAMGRMAHRAESVLKQVEQELPETAALMRLTGLEVNEAIGEASSLGSELTSGIRSTAKLASMTEAGVKQGLEVAKQLPAVLAAKETEARGEMGWA